MDRLAPSSGTLILVDSEARHAFGDSGPITGLGGMTGLKIQLHVTEVSGLGDSPGESPTLFVVVEETSDGTNWNQIDQLPPPPSQPQDLITDVTRQTITLEGPLAETIRFRWTISGTSPLFTFSVTSPACWSPPTVILVSPSDGATQVALNTAVRAFFSEDMDPATLTASTFTLVKDGSATPVDATVSYDLATKRATLDPSVDLEAGAKYTATVKGGAIGCTSCVKDKTGNPLAPTGSDEVWSFTTRDDITPP